MSLRAQLLLYGFALFMALLVGALCTLTMAHFEAKAYERVTGHRVSTWDAVFLDLRVQAPPDTIRRGP